MLNYILADTKRILLRLPRLIVILAILMCYAFLTINSNSQESATFITFLSFFKTFISYALMALGLITFSAVYADDFKAKTMQVAIGHGVSRCKVILSKIIEVMIIQLADLILFFIVTIIAAVIAKISLQPSHIMEITAYIFTAWLKCVAYAVIVSIIVFATQATALATVAYIAVASGSFNAIFSNAVLMSDGIAVFHLERFTLTALLDLFQVRLALGSFDLAVFIGILVYIALSFAVILAIFSKRELEF